MPIEYSTGSIFDCGADVLVCPVNCMGVMGKGLALEFKKRWPWIESAYKGACKRAVLLPGDVAEFSQLNDKDVWMVATKDHWRNPTRLDWVNTGLQNLRRCVLVNEPVIAIPALGCGLGGLDWADVKPLIEKHFADWPGRVIVFPPKGDG